MFEMSGDTCNVQYLQSNWSCLLIYQVSIRLCSRSSASAVPSSQRTTGRRSPFVQITRIASVSDFLIKLRKPDGSIISQWNPPLLPVWPQRQNHKWVEMRRHNEYVPCSPIYDAHVHRLRRLSANHRFLRQNTDRSNRWADLGSSISWLFTFSTATQRLCDVCVAIRIWLIADTKISHMRTLRWSSMQQ